MSKPLTKTKQTKRSIPYQELLNKNLKDDAGEGIEYLSTTLENPDEPELFLRALRNVAEAWEFAHLADITGLNRESMYKMLSDKGNPKLSSLMTLLDGMGLQLAVIRKNK